MNIDYFTEGPVDPRIYNEMATDIWRLAVSYLPIRDVLKLPNLCKYFNEEIVWHKHSGRLLWGEMAPGTLDEYVYEWRPGKPPKWYHYNRDMCLTVLTRACYEGAPLTHVSTLLAGRADVNVVDQQYRMTALIWACKCRRDLIVRKLLEANADPNIKDTSTWPPLTHASFHGYAQIASALLEHGANVNHTSYSGGTALITACEYGHVDVVRVLMDARADVNAIATFRHTPILMACRGAYVDIVRILIDARADVNVRDDWSRPISQSTHNKTIKEMLLSAGEEQHCARTKAYPNIVD